MPFACLVRLALHHIHKELNVEESDSDDAHPDTGLACVLLRENLAPLLLIVLNNDINRLLFQIVQLVNLITEHEELKDDVANESQLTQNAKEL